MSVLPSQNRGASKERARLSGRFWRLWWANAVNCLGDGAFVTAMPLLAITVTRNPVQISAITAAEFLPWLVVSLPAGALVDRYDRATLMWRCQAFQAAVVIAIAVAAGTRQANIPMLVIAGFLLGCAQVVITNAAQSILPQLVPAELRQRANSNQYMVQTIGQSSLGPPLGSLLFTLAAALPFGVDAGSFVVSASLLATLPKTGVPATSRPPMLKAIAEGLRWLLRHRLLRLLAVLLGVNAFCNQMGFATLVLLATVTLHLSFREFGLLLVAVAIGSVLGGLINARLALRLGALPVFVAALAANAVVYAAMGLAPDGIVLGALLALCGLIITVSSVVTVGLRQQIVPNELLGRVNSVFRMVSWGLTPLGALAGGFCAQQLGLRAPFLIAGGLRTVVLIAVLPVLVPGIRSLKVAEQASGKRAGLAGHQSDSR